MPDTQTFDPSKPFSVAAVGGFDPSKPFSVESTAPATADALVENIKNLGMGALKSAARVGQMIPGVAATTDAAFGLPSGASRTATEPSNTGEKVGGLAADAALTGAIGAADLPMTMPNGVRLVNNKTVGQVVGQKIAAGSGAALDALEGVSRGAMQAVKAEIGTGPVTAEKVGALATKYGFKAVHAVLNGMGIGIAYDALKAMFK